MTELQKLLENLNYKPKNDVSSIIQTALIILQKFNTEKIVSLLKKQNSFDHNEALALCFIVYKIFYHSNLQEFINYMTEIISKCHKLTINYLDENSEIYKIFKLYFNELYNSFSFDTLKKISHFIKICYFHYNFKIVSKILNVFLDNYNIASYNDPVLDSIYGLLYNNLTYCYTSFENIYIFKIIKSLKNHPNIYDFVSDLFLVSINKGGYTDFIYDTKLYLLFDNSQKMSLFLNILKNKCLETNTENLIKTILNSKSDAFLGSLGYFLLYLTDIYPEALFHIENELVFYSNLFPYLPLKKIQHIIKLFKTKPEIKIACLINVPNFNPNTNIELLKKYLNSFMELLKAEFPLVKISNLTIKKLSDSELLELVSRSFRYMYNPENDCETIYIPIRFSFDNEALNLINKRLFPLILHNSEVQYLYTKFLKAQKNKHLVNFF